MGQEEPVTTAIGSFITNERDWEQRAQESLITRGANVARFSLTVALAGASLVVALPELLDKDRRAWPFWSLRCAVATLIAAEEFWDFEWAGWFAFGKCESNGCSGKRNMVTARCRLILISDTSAV